MSLQKIIIWWCHLLGIYDDTAIMVASGVFAAISGTVAIYISVVLIYFTVMFFIVQIIKMFYYGGR